MISMKQWAKRLLLPVGERPYRIRGGALKGLLFNIDLQNDTQVWRGIYEESLQQWLVKYVCDDSVCFDVGAAEGWATLLMAKLASNGKVFAFEPSDRGDRVERNLALNNNLPLATVNLSRSYVSNRSYTSEDDLHFVSLDDFARQEQLKRVDVIKIDVDGPENDVLDGAKDVLKRFQPSICVEAHSHILLDGVIDRLHALGYRTDVVDPPPHEHRPINYNPMVFGTTVGR